jgi:hypothetical protein
MDEEEKRVAGKQGRRRKNRDGTGTWHRVNPSAGGGRAALVQNIGNQ